MLPGWLEIILRSLSGFVILIITSKVIINKSVAQFSYFDVGASFIIGVMIAVGSFHLGIPIGYTGIALLVWIVLIAGTEYLSLKSKTFRNIIYGKGIPVIMDGKILEDNLKKKRYTSEDLLKQLRSKNVFQVADVEFAVLEASGDINVLLKKANQPVTPKEMGITVAPIKQPETVVMDGKILDEPLATLGLNRKWLVAELDKQGVAIENVFLGQVDRYGELFVDLFDDQLKVQQPQDRLLLHASIKKVQADLEIFALETKNNRAKTLFSDCSKKMDEVLTKIKPYLK